MYGKSNTESHRESSIAHFCKRMWTRYKINLNRPDVYEIEKLIGTTHSIALPMANERKKNPRSLNLIYWHKRVFPVIYDATTKTVVTVFERRFVYDKTKRRIGYYYTKLYLKERLGACFDDSLELESYSKKIAKNTRLLSYSESDFITYLPDNELLGIRQFYFVRYDTHLAGIDELILPGDEQYEQYQNLITADVIANMISKAVWYEKWDTGKRFPRLKGDAKQMLLQNDQTIDVKDYKVSAVLVNDQLIVGIIKDGKILGVLEPCTRHQILYHYLVEKLQKTTIQ